MAAGRFNDPIEPLTLGNMRANGARSLDVSCWICHLQAIISAAPWPDDAPVPASPIAALRQRVEDGDSRGVTRAGRLFASRMRLRAVGTPPKPWRYAAELLGQEARMELWLMDGMIIIGAYFGLRH
jgi:hypothetical protein